MADKLNPKQVGVTTGLFAAILHAAWSILVAIGVAQQLSSWLIGLHFVSDQHTVTGFNIGTAVLLIVVAFVAWFVLGWVFASLYNWTAKKVK